MNTHLILLLILVAALGLEIKMSIGKK